VKLMCQAFFSPTKKRNPGVAVITGFIVVERRIVVVVTIVVGSEKRRDRTTTCHATGSLLQVLYMCLLSKLKFSINVRIVKRFGILDRSARNFTKAVTRAFAKRLHN